MSKNRKEVHFMAIENNLRVIMAIKRINSITELMAKTKLSRNALNKLWHNENIETVKLETLFQICDALDIELHELITYKPDKEEIRIPVFTES